MIEKKLPITAADADGLIVAVAEDTGQTGAYDEMATWCDFAFSSYPPIPAAVMDEIKRCDAAGEAKPHAFKAVALAAYNRTLDEIRSKK